MTEHTGAPIRRETASGDARFRVLFIIGTLEIGGSESQTAELASRLDQSHFRTAVFCLSRGGPFATLLESRGIEVRVFGITRSDLRAPWRLASHLAALWSFIAAWRPHIVHGVLFWSYVLGAIAARLSGVPVVVAGRRSLADFKRGKPHYQILERLANQLTDRIVANSHAVRADTIRAERIDPGKIVVIYNGIDTTMFDVRYEPPDTDFLGLSRPAPLVVVVASLIPYKGHEYFLEAWRRVADRFPSARALLVGDGPERLRLERLAAQIGLGESVRFLGVRSDVARIVRAAYVLVHPSLQEGFSNAILEAMAAGKPVVATEVGGNPEAIVHEVTGLIVPPRDASAIAAAVGRLLLDPDLARRLGQEGRRRAREHFDISTMVQRYEMLYRELLGARVTRAGRIGP